MESKLLGLFSFKLTFNKSEHNELNRANTSIYSYLMGALTLQIEITNNNWNTNIN